MSSKHILIVDDEAPMRKNVFDLLSTKGYSLSEADNGEEAVEIIKTENVDLVLLDINLPGIDGLTTLNQIKTFNSDLPVIIFTAYGTSERAIEAMKSGAYDYIEKPFELDEFLLIIERALEFSDLVGEVKELRSIVSTQQDTDDGQIIGSSKVMKDIFKTIGRVSPSDVTVFIQGESGTGKELIADAIQRHSLRKNKPYVKVNCGGLSESILESEIFGHEKGAFTGAVAQRLGRFEIADGGTIFLDEINNMPQSLQVKILRVMQNQSFFRVGGEEPIKVNVRIIAASNTDVEKEVEKGRFRKDLYYRLNVVRINLPLLSDRPQDIPLLVKHFLKKYSPEQELVVPFEEMQRLLNYSWPGNIRELENVIQRAIVMARKNIITVGKLGTTEKKADINAFIQNEIEQGKGFKQIVNGIEKELILTALHKNNGNRSKAAESLQIHRRLLYSKMKEYDINL